MLTKQNIKNDKCFGGKQSKEQVTLMVCSNMTGIEKQKLLIIGKSKNPRRFKDIKSLKTKYNLNNKAWMTLDIF